MDKIQMVDLQRQYVKLQDYIDNGLKNVMLSAAFINGPEVKKLEADLASYLDVNHVIGCGNGTDALQIALMALGLEPGDEVIVQDFTYVASGEVIALLGLRPIIVDVRLDDFNLDVERFEQYITPRTKAIIPVHLFGQSCHMAPIMEIAEKHKLFVIEDNAQSIGATYTFPDGRKAKTGTIGHIGTTSFYPSKNLGCYGDGGAICTNDEALSKRIRAIANHGQSSRRYYHDLVGVNSRLDSFQAVVLNAKLPELDSYNARRIEVADYYDRELADIDALLTPARVPYSTHVFHQYTLRVLDGRRDALKDFLAEAEVPSMIYYPVPFHGQAPYAAYLDESIDVSNTNLLVDQVISLPMHSELSADQLSYIVSQVRRFFS